MKQQIVNLALIVASSVAFETMAQMNVPALSPLGKVEQKVGVTNVSVEYSRPSKKGRNVFPDVVPYGQIWRTGANKNTIISFDKNIEIHGRSIPAGSYSIFTIPEREYWTVFICKGTEYRGVPEKWDDKIVVAKTEARIKEVRDVESFTISIDDVTLNSASLVFSWDRISASVPFKVLDAEYIEKSIRGTLSQKPTASDYYQAADYYVNSKGDMKQALKWINTALEMIEKSGDKTPYWYLERKAEIHANLEDYKGAMTTAEKGLRLAQEARDEHYAKTFESMMRKWNEGGRK